MKTDFTEECITYIFSLSSTDVQPGYTHKIVEDHLKRITSEEIADLYLEQNYRIFLSEFVDEYNSRLREGLHLCFKFIDDDGEKITTYDDEDTRLAVVRSLAVLTPSEFEVFGTCIMKEIGCSEVFLTPASHDQGLDGFGYFIQSVGKRKDNLIKGVVFIQVKHYTEEIIVSKDIREYVGSVELAKDKIWAVAKDKYPQLQIKKYTPIRLIYLTSGHVKRTTKQICDRAGIDLITRDDLVEMYRECTSPEIFRKYISELSHDVIGL